MNIEPEKFLKIKYEGMGDYFVSNWHRVFSLKSGKFIKPYLHKSRSSYYWRFNIGKKKIMGHVLVAAHFKKCDDPLKTQVEHLDNNTLNNNSSNLIWATPSDNQKFRYKKSKIPEWLSDLYKERLIQKAAQKGPPLTQKHPLPKRQKTD